MASRVQTADNQRASRSPGLACAAPPAPPTPGQFDTESVPGMASRESTPSATLTRRIKTGPVATLLPPRFTVAGGSCYDVGNRQSGPMGQTMLKVESEQYQTDHGSTGKERTPFWPSADPIVYTTYERAPCLPGDWFVPCEGLDAWINRHRDFDAIDPGHRHPGNQAADPNALAPEQAFFNRVPHRGAALVLVALYYLDTSQPRATTESCPSQQRHRHSPSAPPSTVDADCTTN
ncbi:hypothetical protein N658DRAFT_66658 [Parathielavia hyrcaniae]|uniref:Uncharacterized protein n=1 Tax=Parathielavia hyrcaniae TaxID=113614 RepID=A0AAN6Q5E3_9PEZI|nr:hypothetical protein N658DRAFT_66658 [Parathielavia hyrcaniae]